MNFFKKNPVQSPAHSSEPTINLTQAEPAQQPISQPAVQKQRRSRPFLFLTLLLLVAIFAAAATYTVLKLAGGVATQTNNLPAQDSNQPEAKANTVTATDAIAAVKPSLTGSTPINEAPLFAIQVAGYDYKTDLGKDSKAFTGVKSNVSAADIMIKRAEIGKTLKDMGFSETIEDSFDTITYVARYMGADAVCHISSSGSFDNPNSSHVVSVLCSDMKAFQEVAAAQQPFHSALSQASRPGANGALYGAPVTKPSKTTGYTLGTLVLGAANMGAGSSELMFYQSPDKTWHYAASMADVGPGPQCSEFSTTEAKAAYLGEMCYNDAVASTVK